MSNPSENSFEKREAAGAPAESLNFDWIEAQSSWHAVQKYALESSTAQQFIPTFDLENHIDVDAHNLTKLSDQNLPVDKIATASSMDNAEQTAKSEPESLDQMVNKLDDTQRKAYEDILQALRDGDLNKIAEIAKQFDSDPSKFVDVYKCISKAVREGDFKDMALIWKYDEQNNSADLKIKQGDKRIAIHIGT